MSMQMLAEPEQFEEAPQYLIGSANNNTRPRPPFDPAVVSFLSELSAHLQKSPAARALADVQAFAFWCRKANLRRLQDAHQDAHTRLGLGLLFHVAPGNVPVNFAFSLAFGLLAGNANIVRLPSRPMEQVDVICDVLATLLSQEKHQQLAGMMSLVRYPADASFTAQFSARADGRIIWGGDQTVADIRQSPLRPRAREVTFADRYSFCVLDAASVVNAEDDVLARLVEGFYNDAYLMDQNACSSPHLVLWRGTPDATKLARLKFWNRLQPLVAERYSLAAVHAVDKYTDLLMEAATDEGAIKAIGRWRNTIHTIELKCLPPVLETLRGRFGLFHEYQTTDLTDIAPLVSERFQTLTYFGIDKVELKDFVITNQLPGIDRIVPVGRALDMDIVWDGYDLIASLSRIIDLR